MYNIVHFEDKNQENWPLKELRARDCFLSANRKQWENQSDSRISNRTQQSFYLLGLVFDYLKSYGVLQFVINDGSLLVLVLWTTRCVFDFCSQPN